MGTNSNNGKAKPLTYDHLVSKKKPIVRRVPVHPDAEIVDEYEAALGEFEQMMLTAEADLARQRTPADTGKERDRQTGIQARFEAAEKALRESELVVVMQSPGNKRYEALILAHPPTDADQAEVVQMYGENAQAPYHAETFGPALVALCCIEPEMTPEQVAVLFEEWNRQESTTLFAEALSVCTRSNVGRLGKGSGLTLGS